MHPSSPEVSDTPTPAGAAQSLREHVVERARRARLSRAGRLDIAAMLDLLQDRSVVRYPMGVRFDAAPLRPGEFACLEPLGEHPRDGWCLNVHPLFAGDARLLPMIIAYHIPSVNYGDVAAHVEAELFGSTLLGLGREAYYRALCGAADAVPAPGDSGDQP